MKDIFSTNNAGKMDIYITKIWAYAETWDLLQKLTPNMLQKGNKESTLKENQGNSEEELQWPKLNNILNNKNIGL